MRAIDDIGEVEEHRAGDMRRAIIGRAVAPLAGEEPGTIGDTQIGGAERTGEPFGGDERFHVRFLSATRRARNSAAVNDL